MDKGELREVAMLAGALSVLLASGAVAGRSTMRFRLPAPDPGPASKRSLRSSTRLSILGRATVLWPVVGAHAMHLQRAGHRKELHRLVASTVGAGAAVQGLRSLVTAPRPAGGAHITTSSFPSGHATMCAASFGAIGLTWSVRCRIPAVVVAAAVATAVARSRVVLGMHWPVDAYAGLLLGWAWLVAVELAIPDRVTVGLGA